MLRIFALAAALCAASPALADVTARYRGPDGAAMLVEANDAGAGRFGPEGGSGYGLFTVEGAFIVWEEEGVVRTARYADLKAAADAEIAALLGEEAVAPPAGDADDEAGGAPLLVPGTRETVGGRTGTAWRGADGEDAGLVLSEDPALAPAGAVLARAVIETPTFESLMLGRPSRFAKELAALLRRGAPLRFAEATLDSAAFDPIPADRFVLPAAPMTVAELQAALAARSESGDE